MKLYVICLNPRCDLDARWYYRNGNNSATAIRFADKLTVDDPMFHTAADMKSVKLVYVGTIIPLEDDDEVGR